MAYVSVESIHIDRRLRTDLAFDIDVIGSDSTTGVVTTADWFDITTDSIGHGWSYRFPQDCLHQRAYRINGQTIIPIDRHLKTNLKCFALSYARKHHIMKKYHKVIDRAFKIQPRVAVTANA